MDDYYGPARYDGQRPDLLLAEYVFLFVTVLVLVFVSVFASKFVFLHESLLPAAVRSMMMVRGP